MGSLESDTTERLHFHFSLSCIGEGNGNHSSILAWEIPWTEEPGGYGSWVGTRVKYNLAVKQQQQILSAKTRGFHTQLDEGPETPRATREASGVPFLRQDEA